METLIVILIVAAAAVYVGRIFYNGFTQKDGCACGCTCCSASDSCSQPAAGNTPDPAPDEEDR
ncbi:MAG: FeoB-associated Cys-rich membrane protein [Desulfobacteraceae bacterium]|jgi:hypothetical protein|nr:FeoB-associated Cys-rich membrane protein [Desulfobacteraceae bacterium]